MRVVNTIILLAFMQQSLAQGNIENITLGRDDSRRLGIVFAAVQESDHLSGMQFPALIVSSPESVSSLSVLYSGLLTQWHANPGDAVQAGQLIATIRSQDILQVQNAWIAALTALEQAEFAAKKDQELFAQGVISRQRLVQTQASLQQARFAGQVGTERLVRAGFTPEQLQALRSEGEGLGTWYLRSPARAELTRRFGNKGDHVSADTPLAAIRGAGNSWIRAQIPIRVARNLQVGQSLRTAADGEQLILRQVTQALDDASQTLGIMAEFVAPSVHLPGEIIAIVLPPADHGLLIPGAAVVHKSDETSVFVRTADGVQARVLELIPAGIDYLATEGISAGEEVAIQGAAVLKGMQMGLGGDE
ncbi:MAG: efflux RND transporter periplasmic adaptor subunit [Pseudomonadales bacterium]|nr:efflux RND transporter periplasmic adaptor subunit [Pseudomonadales bacterium]